VSLEEIARWVQDHPYQGIGVFGALFAFFAVNDVWHRVVRRHLNKQLRMWKAMPGTALPSPAPQRRLVTSRDLHTMDAVAFEHYVADMFRSHGYQATVTQQSRDGGKDIVLNKDGRVIYVECKHYAAAKTVGVDIIRAAHSVVNTDRADFGFVVTATNISPDARTYAMRVHPRMYCIDGALLLRLLNNEPGADLFA
jgi:hypothetical protein